MFGFMGMAFNYESRKISNTKTALPDGRPVEVDTCYVTDSGEYTSETAVSIEGGDWVVVQCYKDGDEAAFNHINWVRIVEHGKLPNPLIDMGMNFFASMYRELTTASLSDGTVVDQE